MSGKIIASLDVEATGLSVQKERIVEIAVILTDEKFHLIDKFHVYINPGVCIPSGSSKIHNIYDKDVAKSPKLSDVKEQLLDIFGRADYCCAYNGLTYDKGVMFYEFERNGFPIPKCFNEVWIDPYLCYSRADMASLFVDTRRRLIDVAKSLGVRYDNAHNALEDTQVMIECVRRSIREGFFPDNAKELINFQFGDKL